MKTYVATYGLYENCHIFATREYAIKAEDETEAERKAKDLGKAIEKVEAAQWLNMCMNDYPDESPDFWAELEELEEIEQEE